MLKFQILFFSHPTWHQLRLTSHLASAKTFLIILHFVSKRMLYLNEIVLGFALSNVRKCCSTNIFMLSILFLHTILCYKKILFQTYSESKMANIDGRLTKKSEILCEKHLPYLVQMIQDQRSIQIQVINYKFSPFGPLVNQQMFCISSNFPTKEECITQCCTSKKVMASFLAKK